MRRNVVVECELPDGRTSSFEPFEADEPLDGIRGFHRDRAFNPVVRASRQAPPTILRRGTVESSKPESTIAQMRSDPLVRRVEWDPEIEPCLTPGKHRDAIRAWGNWQTVRDACSFSLLGDETSGRGKGVYVCLVDTGINTAELSKTPELSEGTDYWRRRFEETGDLGTGAAVSHRIVEGARATMASDLGKPFDAMPKSHASMMAFDASILAPKSLLVDLPVLRGGTLKPLLSGATAVFSALSDLLENEWSGRASFVVNNSWQLKNPAAPGAWDFNQTSSTFNRQIERLAGLGVDILFASGNCGVGGCAARGPDTIYGANSHTGVLTVSAANVYGDFLTVSSRGRGWIVEKKPDFCSYSYFNGSGINLFAEGNPTIMDGGTSAACAVASGLVAAVRSRLNQSNRAVEPQTIRELIRRHSWRGVETTDTGDSERIKGHDPDYGFGVLDVEALLRELSLL